MKKISALLVSIFMLFALTFNHAVKAEDGSYVETSQTVSQDVDTLRNRAITGQDNKQNAPAEYLVQQAPDVPDDYWAAMEINACIKEGIIPLNADGTFSPEEVVKRVDFAAWILNALEKEKNYL